MNIYIRSIVTLFVISFAVHVSSANRFYTLNGKLYDPCDIEFKIHGVNYAPYNWGYNTNELLLDQIALTGANAVRMAWYANNPDIQTQSVYRATKLGEALDKCTAQGMLPIVELHDQTCQNNPQALISLADYYLQPDVKIMLQARQDKLVLNSANEVLHVLWATNSNSALSAYKNTYSAIITKLRNAGYICPLMIDAPDCGTNSDALVAVGQELLNADDQQNLIFSVHSYWYSYAGNNPVTMRAKIQSMIDAGIPFVVGEVANQQDDTQNCQYTLPYQQFLTDCQSMGVGWLAWSWCNDVCPNRQMSTTGLFANLTTFGNELVHNSTFGLKANSNKSNYLTINGCNFSAIHQPLLPNCHIPITIHPLQDGWLVQSSHTLPLELSLIDLVGQLIWSSTIQPHESKSISNRIYKGAFFLKLVDSDSRTEVRKVELH